jgi:hypothetical protein
MGEGDPKLVYDEEADLFRFRSDGRFAFSREYADWELLSAHPEQVSGYELQ